MAKWILNKNDANIELMAQTLKINPNLAYILANRGVRSKNAAIKYLFPDKKYMHDSSKFKDIDKAAGIINRAIGENKKIAVYGDYDVDGVTSTVILYKTLKAFGADAIFYIPDREAEGYGLNVKAVESLAAKGIDVLITCDNGISSIQEVLTAKRLGMEVVIIDHHEPAFAEENGIRTDVIPEADAVVNPKQADCEYPFKLMCAAGICYKFSGYLHEKLHKPFLLDNELLVFAAIATFCDVVDLVDENRILAKAGLDLLRSGLCDNLGLKALVSERELVYNKIGGFEVGFIIGPCINATGRLDKASISVDLFLSETEEEARILAAKLAALNTERKDLTAKSVEDTLQSLRELQEGADKVLVIYDPQIHESIAGIVAGRVKDSMNRPAIVLTQSGDLVKGSARSIEGYNIFEELFACKDLFERFGGHSMAAGLSLKAKNVDELRRRLNEACTLTEDDFIPKLLIDEEIALDDATFEFATQLEALAPFGKENKEPVFSTKEIFTEMVEIIGQSGKTMRFTFRSDSGRKMKGICFNKVDLFMDMLSKSYSKAVCEKFSLGKFKNITIKIDIAYYIDINEFNGNKSVQLKIVDFIF